MIRIVDNLYRGPRPDLADLQARGIKRVINLESYIYDFMSNDAYDKEEKRPQDFGIQLVHIPLSDFFPPSPAAVSLAVQFMRQASVDTSIYVHCFSGVDRTGFVCAKYRMQVQGWTKDQAVAESKALGMHWWYYWWLRWL